MFLSLDQINETISFSNLNANEYIPIVEDIVNMERVTVQTYRVVHDMYNYLESDYQMTQAQIFLCLLDRHSRM